MIIITAYHGTSKENAERILKEGFRIQRDSQQYPNDLGHGIYGYIDSEPQHGDVYFMRSAKENAALFARQIRKIPDDQIEVLRIRISLKLDNYLDLNEINNRNEMLKAFEREMKSALKFASNQYKVNRTSKRGQTDGVLLEYLNEKGSLKLPDVLIKDTYTRFYGGLSNFSNGREIVVRKESVIQMISLQ